MSGVGAQAQVLHEGGATLTGGLDTDPADGRMMSDKDPVLRSATVSCEGAPSPNMK